MSLYNVTKYQKMSTCSYTIWAPSSDFVSSSIPSWQILTAHAQPFRGARDLAFCVKVPLDSLLVWASSEGSGETARMRRLAWTFAARIGGKYQRTSMLKARIFPKRLTKWGGIFKSINCEFLSCIWSNRYVNHVKTNFWWFKYHQMGR